MSTNLDRFKSDLAKLIQLGDEMWRDLQERKGAKPKKTGRAAAEATIDVAGIFESEYQRWYTDASAVIRQLMPERSVEFAHLYQGDGKRRLIDGRTYHVQDWLNGVRAGAYLPGQRYYDDFAIVVMRFSTQRAILAAVGSRFASSLHDIAQLARADLFDSELDAARELAKNGFLRAAGAIAGVVIEKHLAQVCTNHGVTVRKQHPAISDLNDPLKNAGVLDVPAWRNIQRLADIRNLCDHNGSREPTAGEVSELVDGTDKLCKTLF